MAGFLARRDVIPQVAENGLILSQQRQERGHSLRGYAACPHMKKKEAKPRHSLDFARLLQCSRGVAAFAAGSLNADRSVHAPVAADLELTRFQLPVVLAHEIRLKRGFVLEVAAWKEWPVYLI